MRRATLLAAFLVVLALHHCPEPETGDLCVNGVDDDLDGDWDCADEDCADHPCCGEPPVDRTCLEERILPGIVIETEPDDVEVE